MGLAQAVTLTEQPKVHHFTNAEWNISGRRGTHIALNFLPAADPDLSTVLQLE